MSLENASIDSVIKFWDSRPCNIRHSNSPLGTKKYFDEVELRKYFVEPHIPSFADFDFWKNKRVLEIGCGIGTDAINFARSGAEYTGLEISKESLKISRQRFEVYGLNGRLMEGSAEEVHELFPGEKFDFIYSFGVLHHTPSITNALNSIRLLMTSESVLKIMVYAKNSWKNALILGGIDQPEAQSGCPIANTYTSDEIREILKSTGFLAQDIRQDHIFPYKVADYVQYKYVLEPWFEVMQEDFFKVLEKSLGWHLLVTSTLDNQTA